MEEIELDAPIFFWMTGPDECGIPLSDALHSRVKRLRDRDVPVFEGRGPSVSIRLEVGPRPPITENFRTDHPSSGQDTVSGVDKYPLRISVAHLDL